MSPSNILSVLCLLQLAACSSGTEQPASSSSSSAPAEAVAAPKQAEAPKPTADDTPYHLALESQPTYTSGQAGTVKLVLEARGGYHVNEEYPLQVDLKAPVAVKLSKASLGKADAVQVGQERALFDLGFSAEPGTHELVASWTLPCVLRRPVSRPSVRWLSRSTCSDRLLRWCADLSAATFRDIGRAAGSFRCKLSLWPT